jgi:RNA polymerase sigma-70 factor, ECF subfamily
MQPVCWSGTRMNIRHDTPACESDMVASAAHGDLEAFNQLVLKYQDLVYSVARSILNDDASAEDAAQETFISAFQHVRAFRGGSFRGWLLRIATNTCYDFLRSQRRRPTVPLYPIDADGKEIESVPWLADPHPSAQAKLESDEFSQTIYRWLDELPEAFRSVINLVDVNGVDYVEAAQALGIPVGTVKSRLARARLRMRDRLSQELGSMQNPGWRAHVPRQIRSTLSL